MRIDWGETVNTLYTAKLFIKGSHLSSFKFAAHDYFLQKIIDIISNLGQKKVSTALNNIHKEN